MGACTYGSSATRIIGFDFLRADQLTDYYHLPVAVFVAAWLVYRKKAAH